MSNWYASDWWAAHSLLVIKNTTSYSWGILALLKCISCHPDSAQSMYLTQSLRLVRRALPLLAPGSVCLIISQANCKTRHQNADQICLRLDKTVVELWMIKNNSGAHFGSTYTKMVTIQRRLSWPLRKDDTQIHEVFLYILCPSPPSWHPLLINTHTHKIQTHSTENPMEPADSWYQYPSLYLYIFLPLQGIINYEVY